MSLRDYKESREISFDYGFYALIMAAARKADDINFAKLKSVFPETIDELKKRYNAPGGYLKGEQKELNFDR